MKFFVALIVLVAAFGLSSGFFTHVDPETNKTENCSPEFTLLTAFVGHSEDVYGSKKGKCRGRTSWPAWLITWFIAVAHENGMTKWCYTEHVFVNASNCCKKFRCCGSCTV